MMMMMMMINGMVCLVLTKLQSKGINEVSMSFTKLFHSVMIAKYYEDTHANKIAGFPQLSLQILFMDSPSLVVVRNFL